MAINKTLCYNMFITCSNSPFFGVRHTKMYVKHKTDINCALCCATCLHLTSSNKQCLEPGMITSLRSKYMTFSYQPGGQITSWLLHMQTFGYGTNSNDGIYRTR